MKNKHLTLDERYTIEHMLNENFSFKAISKILKRDCSTISKEVKRHMLFEKRGSVGKVFNDCINRTSCNISYLCKPNCYFSRCSSCSKCYLYCSKYEKEVCKKLLSHPYVCNGCKKNHICTLERRKYKAISSHKEYNIVKSESREGINISEDELKRIDTIVRPLILKGHSLYNIWFHNKDNLMISYKTLYNYVNASLLSVRNIDLPRKVKFRPRKSKPIEFKVDSSCRFKRSYADFESFINDYPDTHVVEMDTVKGSYSGKVLLTMVFNNCNLLLAFLRDANNSKSVIDIFDSLYEKLGKDNFKKLFPIILTDNGSEFSNPSKLEFDSEGNRRTRIFYCDPGKAWQKPHIENIHTMIRRIYPSGSSFNDLIQDDICKMVNNINSYTRKKLNNESPLSLFSYLYGASLPTLLGLEKINHKNISLK